ncbi:uncharacterized protein LOC112681043 [Sipha flava]|uniref:Uncharacterized protein LOC112681043 n=1 Tax=Sipha flava TaxID=143950 RepID=A0A8B8F9N2_9HEMI|nr:uncharacterized protein LOC112681043 [Sipha flava]
MFLQNHGLGESCSLAQKRLFNLESRLNKDPALYAEYQQFMKEYLALGHMKRVTQAGKYFIPHHAVVKRDGKKIEKLRVVFDASAATSSGLSLNNVLIAGPKLQIDIFDIFVRSRLKRYLLTADITKMYRQILLKPNDCAYQHILWRESPEEEVIEYELRTVTYGVTSALYLAIQCLHELDAQAGSKFPAVKNILNRQTYVDDIVVGADTEVELSIIQRDIIGLLNSCGCTLKKWTSNCPVILENIDTKDHAKLLSLDPKGEASVKVLGLHWDPSSDHFAYHTSLRAGQYTKRKVLSTIARLFDPIGFLGPTLLWAKIFMQELWKLGLHWDTPLPTHLHCSWDQFVRELPELDSIILPRHIDIRSHTEIQLIGFSDASSNGYAANVYLRVISTSNSINIYFVTCKTKVTPLKAADPHASLSIPRLELCGALLLAQTLNQVKTLLMSEISISRVLAWTDSTVVLSWLTAPQKTFKIFVTNRIAKIHFLLPDCEWAYVNTKENPADPASRGLLPAATVACKRHREGPDFLRFSYAQWPKYNFIPITPEKLPEFQPPSVFISTITSTEPQDDILQRFSSFIRMQRTLAYIRRLAIKAHRQPMPDGPLKQEELHHILIHAVLITQARYFPELKGQLIKTDGILKPATIAQLAPFIDPLGVIRVGGRLRYASLDSDAKQPILLPKRSHLTQLIIRHFHQGFLHTGLKLVLSMIRRQFWILSSRDAVRQFIFSCVTCIRFKTCRPHPIMGNLPSSRVQQNRPFSQVGMDYGGPFLVKESRRRNPRTNKMYLALFICMSVKAVHLEIVSDMSSTAFLAAFNRFVARRGIPSNIYTTTKGVISG